MFQVAGSYEIIQENTICNAETLNEIKSEDECEIVAQELRLQFGGVIDVADGFPACAVDRNSNNNVFININENPKRINVPKGYAAICKGK